jgi:hypothetical protein
MYATNAILFAVAFICSACSSLPSAEQTTTNSPELRFIGFTHDYHSPLFRVTNPTSVPLWLTAYPYGNHPVTASVFLSYGNWDDGTALGCGVPGAAFKLYELGPHDSLIFEEWFTPKTELSETQAMRIALRFRRSPRWDASEITVWSDKVPIPGSPASLPATAPVADPLPRHPTDPVSDFKRRLAQSGSLVFRSWNGKWGGTDQDIDIHFRSDGRVNVTEYADNVLKHTGTYRITDEGRIALQLGEASPLLRLGLDHGSLTLAPVAPDTEPDATPNRLLNVPDAAWPFRLILREAAIRSTASRWNDRGLGNTLYANRKRDEIRSEGDEP